MTEDIILANVDEWTIEYKSGECYSWCKRGQQSEFRTLHYQGSTSLIFWILSNGHYFWTITKNYINGSIFVQFLKHFEILYHKEKSISMKRMILWLDNCSSHRSQHSVKFMEKLKINFMFIPTYSPQLAAVELAFNTLKKRLNSSANGRTIKLAQEEGFEKISSCIRRFRVSEIRSYFRKVFELIEHYLDLSIENAYPSKLMVDKNQNEFLYSIM